MNNLTFTDVQVVAYTADVIPDVCLGLVSSGAGVKDVLMVGEINTPWQHTWTILAGSLSPRAFSFRAIFPLTRFGSDPSFLY